MLSTTAPTDATAIRELHAIVDAQRAAFLADPFPSLEERQDLLGALAAMVLSNRTRIEAAMRADFGVHPTLATDLIEVLGVAGSKDEDTADEVLRRTTSGGACANTAAVHGALPSLPFGGIGRSGSGRHHGIDGCTAFEQATPTDSP